MPGLAGQFCQMESAMSSAYRKAIFSHEPFSYYLPKPREFFLIKAIY